MAGEVHPTNIYQAPTLCLALGTVLSVAGIVPPLWSSRPSGEDEPGQQWSSRHPGSTAEGTRKSLPKLRRSWGEMQRGVGVFQGGEAA